MMAKRTGRVAVTRVIDEWAATQTLNPRTLAFEMADALRSMSQSGATIPRDKATIVGVASDEGGPDELPWHSLADYFDNFGSGGTHNRIITHHGECAPTALLLERSWVESLTAEAVARAEVAAGYVQALPSVPQTGGAAALGYYQPEAPSGSAPECLKAREARLRREGEASAAEQLDALLAKLAKAEREAALLRAENATLKAQVSQEQESSESLRRELSESERERGKQAEQRIEAEQAAIEAKQKTEAAVATFSHLEGSLKRVASLFSVTQAIPAQGTGLTFPYATKELEAMRAAMVKYWEGYTPEKRQPTQKSIALTLGELLDLPQQANGDAARKAIVLASAIKPDTLLDR
ncbi:hypothetical protein ACYCFC_15355 [Stutzerimonas sp. NM35]